MSLASAQQQGQHHGAHLRHKSYQALPNVLLGNIPGAMQFDSRNMHEATLQPGPLGLRANWKTGHVTEVPAGGQAALAGVRIGMVLVQINGQKYTERLLEICKSGQRPYMLSFLCQDADALAQHTVKKRPNTPDLLPSNSEGVSSSSGHAPCIVPTNSDNHQHGCLAPGSGTKLLACIGLDLCGNASYLLPEVGESADLIFAPMQAIALRAMFHSNTIPVIGLAEELLPGTDFIPTATIAWCLEAAGYLPPPDLPQVGGDIALRPAPLAGH